MPSSQWQLASPPPTGTCGAPGEFKARSKREPLAEHPGLTVNERLVRSERLTKRDPERDVARAQQYDLAAFFRRAREFGICDP